MLSATGRTTLLVHSFCPPPVYCQFNNCQLPPKNLKYWILVARVTTDISDIRYVLN